MPVRFRFSLFGKKRGSRRTGSRIAGGLGEAGFFGVLLLLGAFSLTIIAIGRLSDGQAMPLQPGFGLWVGVLVSASFVLIGGVGMAYGLLNVGTSVERRTALVKKATSLDVLREDGEQHRQFPTVPRDAVVSDSPGVVQAFRLPATQTAGWRLGTVLGFFTALTVIMLLVGGLAARLHWLQRPDLALSTFAGVMLLFYCWTTQKLALGVWRHLQISPTCVEISHHPLLPGGEYAMFVSQPGRALLNSYDVTFVCEEEASFHQGTDLRHETRIVRRIPIQHAEQVRIDNETPLEIQSRFEIPADAMHSFVSEHNSIRWRVQIDGTTNRNWAFRRAFPVIVFPNTNQGPAHHGLTHSVLSE